MTVRWRTPVDTATPDPLDALDDEALVRCAQQHPEAFNTVFERYGKEIERYIHHRTNGTTELAEDLASQVFTRAFAALPRYQAGSLRGWLYQIARNLVIDHLRQSRPDIPLAASGDLISADPSMEDRIVAEEARTQLHSALDLLPDQQRRIILLRLQGHTGPEIAAQLGISHDAVRSAQYRAMTTLRHALAHLYQREDA